MNQKPDPAAPVITIDGPSASGKGTISALVARALGWQMLDSGALYRLVAYAALKHSIPLNDVAGLERLARKLNARFETRLNGRETTIYLDDENVTTAIRSEKCGNAASTVAAIPQVRTALLDRQRAFQQLPGLVADGRDMGTVVFPGAALKIFLTASAQERAKRRYKQLMEKGANVNLADLFNEIAERDLRDSQRATAPLKPANDAVELDTTHMTIPAVVEYILKLYRERQ
ncbi:MAG: (d)CMP kinase [Gammaproteobacteria bacterium]|nr:(d)CMP kinase [Gammaproteobacteria bacterium]